MGEGERREYEKVNGYKSLLTEVHEVYGGVDIESLESKDELKDYITSNSSYLTLKTNDEGEQEYHPYFSDNEFSALVNSNRLLLVEDICYKIFDDGIVVSHKDNIDFLSSLKGNYAKDIVENKMIVISLFEEEEISPKSSCHPSKNVKRVNNGRNRTKLKLRAHRQIHSISQDSNGGITSITTRVRTFGRIRPYPPD